MGISWSSNFTQRNLPSFPRDVGDVPIKLPRGQERHGTPAAGALRAEPAGWARDAAPVRSASGDWDFSSEIPREVLVFTMENGDL